MIYISVWCGDLSDQYLKQISQIGADFVDFHYPGQFPGTNEQGYPDLDGVLSVRKKLQSWGLDINRGTLLVSEKIIQDLPGAEKDLENLCHTLKVYAEAGVRVAKVSHADRGRFGDVMFRYQSYHRGGLMTRGESIDLNRNKPEKRSFEELEKWWEQFCVVYSQLVPIADEYKIKLAIHPADPPLPDAPMGGLGYHRVIDAFPSKQVGYLYCIGTRAEAGSTPLVLDEINNYGRRGRIFMCHFRNVRGSLATAGGFEEVLLDDGDMNMFRILQALQKVGFDGCLNPDHTCQLEGDNANGVLGVAYSVAYIKGLLAALSVV